jgi:hypothetical protein
MNKELPDSYSRPLSVSAVLLALLLAAAGLTPALATAATIEIKPGKWRLTTEVSSPLQPQPYTQHNTQCITPEKASRNVEDMMADMQQTADGMQNCTLIKASEAPGTAALTMECSMPGLNMKTVANFRVTYTDTRFETHADTVIDAMGQRVETSVHSVGEYVSACD